MRAERGENITLDTLRKIAVHLPLTELTLLDTTGLRVDAIADPQKLFLGALENVIRLSEALLGAIHLAMDARVAVERARRTAPPPPPELQRPADADPIFFLRGLEKLAGEIETLTKEAKIA